MSAPQKKTSLWLALLTCCAVATGLLVLQSLGTDPSAWAQSESSTDGSALGVPIGTILPYVGSLEALPSNWLPCDGRTVQDTGSPLNGSSVPDLTEGRFLMGVGAGESAGTTGGTNTIALDGRHAHGGTATDRITQKTGTPRNLEITGSKGFKHTHALALRLEGQHSHGGDNRPNFYGVRFIIRVR